MIRFIDAHTHAHFAAFEKDWPEVIRRALDKGVWVVNVGTQLDTSRKAVEVADHFKEGVYAVIGLHPTHTGPSFHDAKELGEGVEAKRFTEAGETFDPEAYAPFAVHPRVVAIGECGLDYFRMEGDIEAAKRRQQEAFAAQVAFAGRFKKPLMIHCRSAFPDLIAMLRDRKAELSAQPGIIHFFTGTPEEAKALAELGFAFTFGGVTTFVRDYDATIRSLPLDRILSETDAPYVSPLPYRGKRNEPAYVIEVVKKLAELRGCGVEEMAEAIFANARRIFSI
jgi:TatD DNase family protein